MCVQHATQTWFAAHGVDAAGYHVAGSMQGVMPALLLLAAGVLVLTLPLIRYDLSRLWMRVRRPHDCEMLRDMSFGLVGLLAPSFGFKVGSLQAGLQDVKSSKWSINSCAGL